jgi:hypothetical protein
MKVRFIEPVQSGHREFQPGDVGQIPDSEAQALIEAKACEPVPSPGLRAVRVSLKLDGEPNQAE